MNLITMIKGIFVKSSNENWVCDYFERADIKNLKTSDWEAVKKHNQAPWNKYMIGEWPVVKNSKDNTFYRLFAYVKDGNITTDGIWTKGKKMFGPGKMEFKVRYNNGKGTWPAIWLRNISSQDPNNWRDNYYEIDVVEYFGNKPYFNHTFHTEASMKKLANPHKGFSFVKKGWNIFEVEWDSSYVKIFANGHLVLDVKDKNNKLPTNYYLIISEQYGYNNKEYKEELPKWFDVEYVKHYIRK